jgi:tetratricopeptide (TPR) repeat protein
LSAGRDLTLVAGNLIQQFRPAPAISALHQLPPAPTHFTGRDADIDALQKALDAPSASGATISAISGKHAGLQGMGGVGKTALAIVLAHRLKYKYPDAQLILDLRGADPEHRPPVTSIEAMQSVIHGFQPEALLPDTLAELAPVYRSVLANGNRRILLLLDNAADAEQVHPLLPPPHCLLLVTSRQHIQFPGLETLRLDCLAPEKSRELLLKLAPRLEGHTEEAAELCGHLPLALEAFAGAVNDKKLYPVPELLERLRAGKDKLMPVEAAFQVSYDLLSDELQRRWTQLAVFPTSFDFQAAAAVWDDSAPAASPASPPTQAGMPAPLSDSTREVGNRRGEGVALGNLGNAYADLGDTCKAIEFIDQQLLIAREIGNRRSEGNALGSLGCAYSDLKHTNKAIEFFERGLELHREIGYRRGECDALGNLGASYATLGNASKAKEFCEQRLVIAREIGDRKGESNALWNSACALDGLGNRSEAITRAESALQIYEAIEDPNAAKVRAKLAAWRGSK